MEAAVDYKQYGKLDAMKDIIDSRGNDKLTKKIPRRTILKNKIIGGDPFILANNGKPAVVKQSDVNLDELEKIFKEKDRKALRTFKFGKYSLSDFVKTPEFGGTPRGKFTAIEDAELKRANETLQNLIVKEAVPFIYLKIGKRIEKVDGMRTEKGTPKSDFNYTYQGNDVFFISHKAYGKKIAFQQYGGMPEAMKFNPNSADIKNFVKAAQKYYSQFGGKFKNGHEVFRTVRDDDVWRKGLFGREYKKGNSRSAQNVDGLFSGVLSYKNLNRKKENIPVFELKGQGVTILHDDPKPTGIYEPVYFIRKEVGKKPKGLEIRDIRALIAPKGLVSGPTLRDPKRNI